MPSSMIDILDAPVPFFVGVHRASLDNYDKPQEVVYVDLDHNTVELGLDEETQQKRECGVLPRRAAEKLHKSVKEIVDKYIPSPEVVRTCGGVWQCGEKCGAGCCTLFEVWRCGHDCLVFTPMLASSITHHAIPHTAVHRPNAH